MHPPRIKSNNPVLDDAVEQATPIIDAIGNQLIGLSALCPVVLAAYFIHVFEQGILGSKMQMPREDVLKFVAEAAANITTIPLPKEKRN